MLRTLRLKRVTKRVLLKKRKKIPVPKKDLLQRRKEVMKRKTLPLLVMMSDVSCSPLATFVLKRGRNSSSSRDLEFVLFGFLSCTLINAPPPSPKLMKKVCFLHSSTSGLSFCYPTNAMLRNFE